MSFYNWSKFCWAQNFIFVVLRNVRAGLDPQVQPTCFHRWSRESGMFSVAYGLCKTLLYLSNSTWKLETYFPSLWVFAKSLTWLTILFFFNAIRCSLETGMCLKALHTGELMWRYQFIFPFFFFLTLLTVKILKSCISCCCSSSYLGSIVFWRKKWEVIGLVRDLLIIQLVYFEEIPISL